MFNPGFTVPLAAPCPQVTTFHDLQHKRYPEYFRWFDLPFWRFLLWAAAHRSRRLIAVSEATRADLLRFYDRREERVVVVPHGVNPEFFTLDRSRTGSVSAVCFHAASAQEYRAAGARLCSQTCADKLVLAGLRGFQTAAIEALIAELGWRSA